MTGKHGATTVLMQPAAAGTGVIPGDALSAKVILSGKVVRKFTLKGVGVTKGAKAAIEAAGGSVVAE